MDQLAQALEEHFGYPSFRPGQRQVIEGILAGRPVLGVMPTGTGKSLCYQLPALLVEGLTLVVSPLIALMKDQVDALTERGIPAAFLNSTQNRGDQRAVLAAARSGQLKMLYVAPERFRYGGAMARIRELPLSMMVVDEAHCISQWGHDFRPDYMQLGAVARDLGITRVSAFTATATGRVRGDIVSQLGMRNPEVVVTGFLRENLHFSVLPIRRMTQKKDYLLRFHAALDGPAVIYCATRKHCEEVATFLRSKRLPTLVYHGGMSDQERDANQNAFLASDEHLMVATNAFGMGVDKPNVRAVIHYDIPGSVDAYYQEAGRAGRDGVPAVCVLLFTYADTRIQEFFIDNSGEDLAPEARVALAEGQREKLRAMVRYAYEEGCRHGAVLRYFGDTSRLVGPEGCGHCDNCTREVGIAGMDAKAVPARGARKGEKVRPPPRSLDEPEEVIVQKVLSIVARSQGRLGIPELARLLRGSVEQGLDHDPLVGTRSFGILSGMRQKSLTDVIRGLGRAGTTQGRRPALTRYGVEVMWRRATVELDIPPFKEKAAKRASAAKERIELDVDQRQIFERLRQARLRAAQERAVPAFLIASNKLLERLAAKQPANDRRAWLDVHGVGEANVDPLREVFAGVLEGPADEAPTST